MNILDFPRRKQGRERVVMVTCYDYTSAAIVNEAAKFAQDSPEPAEAELWTDIYA